MSKNAQRNQHATFIKKCNRVQISAGFNVVPAQPRPQAPALPDPTPATYPTKFGCIAYITGFGFDYRTPKFVPVIRKAEAVPAWKSPTLRSSHVL